MAATLAYDDFNRTASTNLGPNWSEISGGWECISGADLRLVNHNAADDVVAWITSLGANPSADYDIEADCHFFSGGGGGGVGPAGRITNINNYYFIQNDVSADEFAIFKKVSGSYTELGVYSTTIADSTWYNIKLSMVGSSLKGYLNGVERVSVTDSAITVTGYPGLRGFGIDNSQTYDDFIVYGVPLAIPNKIYAKNVAVTRAGSY